MPRFLQATSVRRFHDLIPYRVREVLLVSSPYDAFILQEDGYLTEKMFFEYKEISLSSAPRFTHVPNGEAAAKLLEERHFDLIIAMTSLAGMDINAFGRKIKSLRPELPVVLLSLDRKRAHQLRDTLDRNAIDAFFVWSGDLVIFLAVIKNIEDRQNVDHDVEVGNVRVIIMIEDSPQYYSSFLGTLYKELMGHSLSLYSEGLSDLYRKMYMKSRPKVLHALSYEEGVELFQRYRHNVLAVICDVRIPKGGELEDKAGLAFARYARRYDPDLPLILQSAQPENREESEELEALFLDKNSPSLLADVREFLSFRLGFGDFIFRTPDGQEFDRARDLRELEEKLATVPEELLIYHASHNHISIWLTARSEFELAEKLRPKRVSDFPTVEACRQHLIQAIRENHRRAHRGIVSDFTEDHFHEDLFTRIGSGYLGGKARGIAFLYQSLADIDPREFQGLPVKIPQTIVITTEAFDQFLSDNDLREFAYASEDDQEINSRFLDSRLHSDLVAKLELVTARLEGPLAVRSSSLLEDSMHQPFAGIYSTLMLPNLHPDPHRRLKDLCAAVKLVFASTFLGNARSYLSATGNRIEEEKMAVIIQRVVGQSYESRFYPHFSGIVQSHNYYPIGPQKPEDGVAHVALGLGRQVVDGGRALRFSPRHAQVIPQFSDPSTLLDSTQRGFWAINLEREDFHETGTGLYSTLQHYELRVAEEDGSLHVVGSVYSPDDQRLRDDLNTRGPRVVTFNNILQYKAIPLPETLLKLLEMTERGLACPVEVEFACDMGSWGRRGRARRELPAPQLYVLQVRPQVSRNVSNSFGAEELEIEDLLCSCTSSLGHGRVTDVCDLLFVVPDRWSPEKNAEVARQVGRINEGLAREGRRCILIGPGRWGSQDEWLGIPVEWSQISQAKVIIEASPGDYQVDPSQGTHFFHNITAQGIGYLMLPPGAKKRNREDENFLDWEWLCCQEAVGETEFLRHLRAAEPFTVILDGKKGRAVIGKPAG